MPYVFVSSPKSVCVKHSRSISRSFSLRWKIGIKLSLENRYLLVFLHSRTTGLRTLRSEFSPMSRTTELNDVCACVTKCLGAWAREQTWRIGLTVKNFLRFSVLIHLTIKQPQNTKPFSWRIINLHRATSTVFFNNKQINMIKSVSTAITETLDNNSSLCKRKTWF